MSAQLLTKGASNLFTRMRVREALITAEYVRSILEYFPDTGVLLWRYRDDASPQWNGRYAGKRAGTLRQDGYRRIRINKLCYLEHRLAFLYMTGSWPEHEVDHRDPSAPGDNRWSAIRPATSAQNNANTRGVSGRALPKGVYLRYRRRFQAQICAGGKKQYLGSYASPEAAQAAYAKAARALHGEFARIS
jgi:hypothetical protein